MKSNEIASCTFAKEFEVHTKSNEIAPISSRHCS
jgi:hypothetical protein